MEISNEYLRRDEAIRRVLELSPEKYFDPLDTGEELSVRKKRDGYILISLAINRSVPNFPFSAFSTKEAIFRLGEMAPNALKRKNFPGSLTTTLSSMKGTKMNFENLKSFMVLKLELWETYHNHKENMANAGFLVQLSLFASLITQSLWPPAWVTKIITLPSLGTFTVYFLLWFLIHYYTRWQLINKRVAAMYYAGFDKSLLYFSTNELTEEDLVICNKTSHPSSRIRNFISRVIYVPRGFTKMDASVVGLPNFIAREIQKMFKIGSGAESLEMLITYSSIILMIIVGIKIFLG